MANDFACLAITDPTDVDSSEALCHFDDAETITVSPDDYDVMQLAASLEMAENFAEWLLTQALRYARLRVKASQDGSVHRIVLTPLGGFVESFDAAAAAAIGFAKGGGS